MESSHLSGSDLLVSRLCEGVHLANQLRELNTQGRTEDWNSIQSITEGLDKICRALSESQGINHIDCKRLDSTIEARLKFMKSIEKWVAEARAVIEPQLAAHDSTEVKVLAAKVFDLERRFGRKGIDVRSMAPAQVLNSSSTSNDAESGAFTQARRDGTMEILNDLQEKYREAFRQMDEYERSRAEDDNLRMEKLDIESTNLVQKIKDRLRVIQNDKHPTLSTSFSRDVLAILISDKITDTIADKVQDCVNFTDVFAKLEIDNLTGNLLEVVCKQIQPTLAVVDVVEPRRR